MDNLEQILKKKKNPKNMADFFPPDFSLGKNFPPSEKITNKKINTFEFTNTLNFFRKVTALSIFVLSLLREMQINTTINHHYTSTIMTKKTN